ncbi:MAG: CidA/LrgA family protein [Parvibaculales bacterium]
MEDKARFLPLVGGLSVLCGCYAAGWLVQWLSQTPVPAGIYGLLILFAGCVAFGRVPAPVRVAGDFLITHMPLFFLPATVSLIGYRDVLRVQGFALTLALTLSTVMALAVAAALMQRLSLGDSGQTGGHDE